MQLRGLVSRALVRASRDGGRVQVVDIQTHEGIHRTGVEVVQPYGLATRPPDGSVVLVFAVGGDQGSMMAIPAAAPAARFGNLAAGEVVLYDAAGNRVALRNGVVEIHAATRVVIHAPELRVEGNIVATGQVSDAAGSMQEMRDTYNIHTHGGPGPSPSMS